MATDAGIERFAVPDSPRGTGWADFVQLTEVRNAGRRIDGGRERDTSPEFLLGGWHEAGQTEPETVVARRDGTVVGFAEYHREEPEVAPVGWFELFVLPEHRRRGIGARLYEEIERLAIADRRATLIADFSSPPRGGPVIAASNGAGGVPADDPGARFALARGYALGQVERLSVAPLPIPDARLAELEAAAARAAGDDYRVVSWVGATPDDLLDAVAALRARMSVDAPADDIDWPEEIWDAARVRVYDERYLKAGSAVFFAVVEHVPSGRLAGYTEIAAHPWSTTAQQGDTLVLSEHRGHRLGMLLKVVNLRAAQRAHPELTGVMTGNSTSNSYMLSINDALGFETFVLNGVWQKAL